MRRTKLAVSASVALLVVTGCDQLSQPKTFNDCILKHMDGVTSDRAAVLINESCRETFSDTRTDDDTELTVPELSKLAGRLGLFGNRYVGSMYNGNTGTTVTSITVTITATLDDNATSREYRHEVAIPPLTAKDVGFNIIVGDEGAEYSWEIASARGYRE